MLTGEPSVSMTAIVEAWRSPSSSATCPNQLHNVRLVALDLCSRSSAASSKTPQSRARGDRRVRGRDISIYRRSAQACGCGFRQSAPM